MIKSVLALIIDYHSSADAEHLSLQLARATALSPPAFKLQILHVDNGNSPATALTPDQQSFGVRLLTTGANLGYAGALNYAIRHEQAQGQSFDAYWFLNSDLEVEPDCLAKLVQVFNDHSQTGAIGPLVRQFPRKEKIWGARGVISPRLGTTAMIDWQKADVLPKWSYIPGCSLLARARAYDQVGGLPEKYKLYYEETDFCVRLQQAGWDLRIEPTATAYHKVDSMKAGIPARHFAYYFIRNNLSFWKTCFGIPIYLQLPRTLYVAWREVILPLRRANHLSEVYDRLKYLAAGLIDGILFTLNRPLHFENKLFK
jgi:GT2 family glycosyltransferase